MEIRDIYILNIFFIVVRKNSNNLIRVGFLANNITYSSLTSINMTIYLQFNQYINDSVNTSLANEISYCKFYQANISIDGVIHYLNRLNMIASESINTTFTDINISASINLTPSTWFMYLTLF